MRTKQFRWERLTTGGDSITIQIIGSKRDSAMPYVRFESSTGKYLGYLDGNGVRSLRAQLAKAFDEEQT